MVERDWYGHYSLFHGSVVLRILLMTIPVNVFPETVEVVLEFTERTNWAEIVLSKYSEMTILAYVRLRCADTESLEFTRLAGKK